MDGVAGGFGACGCQLNVGVMLTMASGSEGMSGSGEQADPCNGGERKIKRGEGERVGPCGIRGQGAVGGSGCGITV